MCMFVSNYCKCHRPPNGTKITVNISNPPSAQSHPFNLVSDNKLSATLAPLNLYEHCKSLGGYQHTYTHAHMYGYIHMYECL